MRTDAKIGFAIGGVLLAVLTVYAIVVPRHKKPANNTVTLVTPPAAQTGTEVVSSSPPPIAAAGTDAPVASSLTLPLPQPKDLVASGSNGSSFNPPTDSTSGSGSMEQFHPVGPKELAKSDDQKSGKLIDGVYTPETAEPTKPAKHSPEAPAVTLPDDSEKTASADHEYTIKPGQTLSKIAYEVYGNSRFWVAIQRENKGLDPNRLKVGRKINLPDISPIQPGPITVSDEHTAADTADASMARPAAHQAAIGDGVMTHNEDGRSYTVKSGDSLYGIAKRLLGSGRKAETLYTLNKDMIGSDKSRLKLGMVLKLPEATKTASAN